MSHDEAAFSFTSLARLMEGKTGDAHFFSFLLALVSEVGWFGRNLDTWNS